MRANAPVLGSPSIGFGSSADKMECVTNLTPTGKLVLVVDDEPAVLRFVTSVLAMAEFKVIVAENGAAGLEAFGEARNQIDLVLADVVMPFMGGLEMAAGIRAIRKNVPILLMTGYSDTVINALPDLEFPLIRKPFLPEDLIRAIWANIAPPAASA